jgi:hypothetical protein
MIGLGAIAAVYFFTLRAHRHPGTPHLARVANASMAPQTPVPPVVKVEDLPPVVMRKLTPEELTPDLIRKSTNVLWKFDSPVGSEILLDSDGKSFIARFEEHFHEIGGPLRPWGFHKGITLYAAE